MSLRSSMLNRTKGQKLDAEYGWMERSGMASVLGMMDWSGPGWKGQKVRMYYRIRWSILGDGCEVSPFYFRVFTDVAIV